MAVLRAQRTNETANISFNVCQPGQIECGDLANAWPQGDRSETTAVGIFVDLDIPTIELLVSLPGPECQLLTLDISGDRVNVRVRLEPAANIIENCDGGRCRAELSTDCNL